MEDRFLKETYAVRESYINEMNESKNKIIAKTGKQIQMPDEMKDVPELVQELKKLKDENKIYSCLLCLSISVGSALTYGGGIAVIASAAIFIPLMVISLIQWVRTQSRIKKLQKLGLDRLHISPER